MSVSKEKKYVAVFDVLGFKSWIKAEGSQKIFTFMKGFMNLMTKVSLPKAVANEDMTVDMKPSLISQISFSDTIVFYSQDDSYESFSTILKVCAHFLNTVICGSRRPIRGALAHGEFYVEPENNACVSQALIDAYELEQKQNWLGMTFHKSIEGSTNFKRAQKEFPLLIIQTQIPFKKRRGEKFALNWTNKIIGPVTFNVMECLDECQERQSDLIENDDVDEKKKLEIKIAQTKEFIEYCQKLTPD